MCFFLILIIIKFIILMKKILLSLFSSTLLFTSFTYAKSDRPLYSIGYAYIKVKDLPTANGINMRIQALPAANKKKSQYNLQELYRINHYQIMAGYVMFLSL
ncbi:hypothetical protein PROPEN_01374 [Proteus penneri ATCC 35198]|nr:hypothetical protein PROPEN_01374 [Proteus penneri ATCC 35198]